MDKKQFAALCRKRGIKEAYAEDFYQDGKVVLTEFVLVHDDGREERYVRGVGDHDMERVAYPYA